MKTEPIALDDLSRSVWAVPPLAMAGADRVADAPNRALIRHIESGGVSTILWGGNANLANATLAAFTHLLDRIPDWCDDATWAIPSVGPDAGRLVEQAPLLRDRRFPAALALPFAGASDPQGIERALRGFVEASCVPLIVYIRRANYLAPDRLAAMIEDGVAVGIKYAVEPEDPAIDPYLEAIIAEVTAARLVSGIGELAAIGHMTGFGVAGFTAGAVCIAPRRAMAVLRALQAGDKSAAEREAAPITALEKLRQTHGPVPVIHAAVTASGVAQMGEIGPMFAPAPPVAMARIEAAVQPLVERVCV